jgi:hypothetical protein
MKMMKFPVLAGSAFTSPNKKHFYINAHDIYEVDGAALVADACTIKFANAASTAEGIITIVMDGVDATSRMQKKPFDLIPTLAEIHTASGITKTGGAGNDAIISITLS